MDETPMKESVENRLDLNLKRELKRAARHKESLSIVVMELLITDEQCHRALFVPLFKQIAGIIRRIIRDEDTEIILGRNVLLILPVTFLDGARIVASKIVRQVMATSFKESADHPGFQMHLIFGFANFPHDGSERQELLDVARNNLKREKEKLLKKLQGP